MKLSLTTLLFTLTAFCVASPTPQDGGYDSFSDGTADPKSDWQWATEHPNDLAITVGGPIRDEYFDAGPIEQITNWHNPQRCLTDDYNGTFKTEEMRWLYWPKPVLHCPEGFLCYFMDHIKGKPWRPPPPLKPVTWCWGKKCEWYCRDDYY